jgi:hypothetical protein
MNDTPSFRDVPEVEDPLGIRLCVTCWDVWWSPVDYPLRASREALNVLRAQLAAAEPMNVFEAFHSTVCGACGRTCAGESVHVIGGRRR